MKKIIPPVLVAVLLLLLVQPVFSTLPPDQIKQRYTKQEVYITMRDGVRLFTSVYTPKDNSKKRPVLFLRTPYSIERGGKDSYNFFMQVYKRYTDDNYIMVFQDVRGKYMSEGIYEDIRPVNSNPKSNKDIDESTDTWDSVDWIVKNIKNNNGNVGIFGISYPGFYSTMGIINSHSAVKAVSPQAPVTAWFLGDDFHHNGAFFVLDCFGFYYNNGRQRTVPGRNGLPGFVFPVSDSYEFFLKNETDNALKLKYFGDTIKFWNDVFANPDYTEFWKARDPRQYLIGVKPAVLTVGGWFDAEDMYGALHTYEAIEKQNPQTVNNYLVMGPWSHGQWSSGTAMNVGNIYWGKDTNERFAQIEKAFFDHWLKNDHAGSPAEANIFITGTNEWREFSKWPPAETGEKKLFLHPGCSASFNQPSGMNSFDEYVSDPAKPVPYTETITTDRTVEYMTDDQRFASKRPDVMVYTSEELKSDMTFTGPVISDLFVSTTGTDADFVVKLIDVFPEGTSMPSSKSETVQYGGYQMLVRGDIFRGKYRNSFEKPEPFVPGEITEVKFTMTDVAHTFKKGHKLMIQVQNSWFPLSDRNPQVFTDIYKCGINDFKKADIKIYHDKEHPSSVTLYELK